MEENTEKKLSYEQLEEVAHQLSEQNRQLYARVQQLDAANLFKRLDYLFKVVENSMLFGEFTEKCVEEIKDLLTLPEETEETKE